MPGSQSRLKRMLQAIQNMFGFQVCVKRRSASVNETDEKLLNILNDLTVGISEVFDDDRRCFEEFLRCDRVSCKISVLNEQISQVRILYSLWKSGYDLDPEDITTKCQSLNLLVDCIRDDVFYAYLRMPPEQKLELLKKNKQVSSIFAVLGSLENEVTDMVKTMLPNGEIMKMIRPLLKPEFNKAVFRRCAQNMLDYHVPRCYQTIQFCYKGLPFEMPMKVDACTDPIDSKEWQELSYVPTDAFGDSFYGTNPFDEGNFDKANTYTNPGTKRSQLTITTRPSIQHSSPKLLPVVADRDLAYWNRSGSDHQAVVGVSTKTFATVDSCGRNEKNRSSRDELSIISDVDDVVGIPSDHFHNVTSHSMEYLDNPRSFGQSESNVNFWKLAADLIVDHPVVD